MLTVFIVCKTLKSQTEKIVIVAFNIVSQPLCHLYFSNSL